MSKISSDLAISKVDAGLGKRTTLVTRHVQVQDAQLYRFFEEQSFFLKRRFKTEWDDAGLDHLFIVDLWVAAMAKRVLFVQQRVLGVAPDIRIQLDHRNLPLPRPVFESIAQLGSVESAILNRRYVPDLDWEGIKPFDTRSDPKLRVALRNYYVFMESISHRYIVAQGLPAELSGSWSYILASRTLEDGSVRVFGPSNEADVAEATLSGVVGYASWLKELLFDVDYGLIVNPDEVAYAYFAMCVKDKKES